ncbi:MAG: signal peptidase I [Alphaproteobacteria bacterium]|nr:signal peptidase I [Alphaproteobacteria bacterium]
MSADALTTDASATRRKKRRPMVAALLSLLCPGLGQLYGAQVSRGTRMLVVTALLGIGLLAMLLVPPTSAVPVALGFASVVVMIGYEIWAAIDAYRVARRAGVAPLSRANRAWVYAVILVAWWVAPGLLEPLTRWKSYNIPAGSMTPTIMVGDYLVAWRGYFASHPPQLGDLVVFKLPRDNATDYVKRIVGLPGQRVQMRDGRLYIDDQMVARERLRTLETDPAHDLRGAAIEYLETLPNGAGHRIFKVSDTGPLDETPVVTVPAGHVFVLGDNRDNSLDSRSPGVGLVPLANLRDRPGVIFWARDLGRLFQTVR